LNINGPSGIEEPEFFPGKLFRFGEIFVSISFLQMKRNRKAARKINT
jgi:hypothetical protein